MNPRHPLTPEAIQNLALAGRITTEDSYHAHEKGIRFADILGAMAWCFRVEPDRRPAHPDGWVALCHDVGSRILRVDFNRRETENGELLFVVTAMHLEPKP